MSPLAPTPPGASGRRPSRPAWALALLIVALVPPRATAAGLPAPQVPVDPETIVERLRSPRTDDGSRARWRELRRQQRAAPQDPERVAAAVQAALGLARREGDPRFLGEAQAVLRPWWAASDPPPVLRLARATVRQALHDFDGALQDLQVLDDPAAIGLPASLRAQAALTRAAVLQLQGRWTEAAAACQRLLDPAWVPPGSEAALAGSACLAELSTLSSDPGPGRALLARLDAGERSPAWLVLLRAQAAERAGDLVEAEAHYRRLSAQPGVEVYALAAHADLLLDQGRWEEVLRLLAQRPPAEALLLRRARAEQQLGRPEAAATRARLQAIAQAQALRGDEGHAREGAWRALHLERDPATALRLAQANWARQKEPIDARLLAEAARAAGQPQAAEPLRAFLRHPGLRDVRLQALLGEGSTP